MTVHRWLAEWSTWGWPLFANHLWQATILSLLAFAAAALLRKGPGRARYAVWLIASAKFFLPSAILVTIAGRLGLDFSSLAPWHGETSQGTAVVTQLTAPVVQWEESAFASQAMVGGHNELFCVLTLIWFAGCVAFLAVRWRHRRRFRMTLKSGAAVARARERATLVRVRTWLGLEGEVRLSIAGGAAGAGV